MKNISYLTLEGLILVQKERESVLKIFFVTVIITDNVGHGNSVYPPPVINKIALCGGIIALHMGTRIQENHDISEIPS